MSETPDAPLHPIVCYACGCWYVTLPDAWTPWGQGATTAAAMADMVATSQRAVL